MGSEYSASERVILGHMTAAAIAANSAAATLFLVVKSAAVGASSTASVLIGKTIGTGDMGLVKRYAEKIAMLVCTDWRGVGDLFVFYSNSSIRPL